LETPSAGKLMAVDLSNTNIHPIFIDDNVYRRSKNTHIVDCRDLNTGDPIEYQNCYDIYVCKPISTESIRDESYFIKLIEHCEKNRQKINGQKMN
jgi:hypothetical protein